MKNSEKLILCLCLFTGILANPIITKAQSVYWHIGGDSNVGANAVLGTLDTFDINFKTNDSVRFKIDRKGAISMYGPVTVDSSYFRGKLNVSSDSGDQLTLIPNTPPLPLHDLLRVSTTIFSVMGGNQTFNPLTTNTVSVALTRMGVNTETPNYITDILGNAIGDGVNISGPSNNAVGYSIGGTAIGNPTMFLWNAGDPTSVFCGYQSGFPNSSTVSAANCENTVVGDQAFMSLNGQNIKQCVALGYRSLYNNLAWYNTGCGVNSLYSTVASATYNTAIGWDAMSAATGPITGDYNSAVGSQALEDNLGGVGNTATGSLSMNRTVGNAAGKAVDNTADGLQSLEFNIDGNYNVAVGVNSLNQNLKNDNSAVGALSGENITNGSLNSCLGYAAMQGTGNITGDSNSSTGIYTLHEITTGHGNSAFGTYAGYSTSNTTGFDNTYLGAKSDANSVVNGATAVGTKAIVAANNQLELGNNAANVTIGLSGFGPVITPPVIGHTNLEIATEHSTAWATGWSTTAAGINYYGPPAGPLGSGTGTSGLRFDDLTSKSSPVSPTSLNFTANTGANPFPAGVLSTDGYGNVIMIPNTGIGYCNINPCGIIAGTGLTKLEASGGYNLNQHNFYFDGNLSSHNNDNSVLIGQGCCAIPKAKLDVLQNSGTTGSIGLIVTNDDKGSCTNPVIGIKSILPTIGSSGQIKMAGWFEANPDGSCCNLSPTQYAIFVPPTGGLVSIGFPYSPCSTASGPTFATLQVSGSTWSTTGWSPSDSTIKIHVNPLSNPLSIIKKMNGVSFNYISSAITDTFCSGLHYGFIAQQVGRILPSLAREGPGAHLGISYTEIIPWLTEGIKQLDSTETVDDSTHWKITGNTGITSSNFIGAIDSTNLMFKTYNTQSGLIDIAHNGTAFGYKALNSFSGIQNTAIGASSLQGGFGNMVTALGYQTTAGPGIITNSTVLGALALVNTSNTMVFGNGQVKYNKFHGQLIFDSTGFNPDSGTDGQFLMSQGANKPNVWRTPGAIAWALTGNSGIASSNFIGAIDSTNLEVRTFNTRSGLIAIDNGNTSWGYKAFQLSSGSKNTAIGEMALANPANGNMVTALGYHSGVSAALVFNSTALGANATVNTSNTMMFGGPQSKYNYLHGQLIFDSTGSNPDTGTDGQFLMSQGPNKPNVWRNGVSQKGYDSLKRAVDSIGSILAGYIHCLDSLCGSGGGHAPIRGNGGNGNSTGNVNPANTQAITLSLSSTPLLYQNTPNPFSSGTTINYFLPEGTTGASMLFFDTYGGLMKTLELNQTGNGTLQVSPDNLTSGIYSYSLVISGKVIDTKRMVLQK